MSVSVEINVGSHGSKIAKGSSELLAQLFEAAGLNGKVVVRCGAQQVGGPKQQGVRGATIKPAGKSPRTVVVTIQPGDNGSRREFLLDVPNGMEVDTFIGRFNVFVSNYEEVSEPSHSDKVKTVGEIKSRLQQLRDEMAGLPATFAEQEKVLAEREADLVKRERALAAERRKLEEDRAGLKQDIGRLNARRRQLEEDIGMAEMELEDAEVSIAEQARGQLEALATSTGMSLDQLLALAQRNGRKA